MGEIVLFGICLILDFLQIRVKFSFLVYLNVFACLFWYHFLEFFREHFSPITNRYLKILKNNRKYERSDQKLDVQKMDKNRKNTSIFLEFDVFGN